jgi:hypothetical protein
MKARRTTLADSVSGSISITRSGASDYLIVADVNGAIRTATSTSGWGTYNAVRLEANPPA